MENIIVAVSISVIVGIAYYIFRNIPPSGGFRGRMA